MRYETKEISLKNGICGILRSPVASDAKEMNMLLKTCFSETEFLMRYPEEWNRTDEDEANFLAHADASQDTLMIVCQIDGKMVGNCTLMFSEKLKTKHRASVAIGILQKYWGLGIGSAMFAEMIAVARKKEFCKWN